MRSKIKPLAITTLLLSSLAILYSFGAKNNTLSNGKAQLNSGNNCNGIAVAEDSSRKEVPVIPGDFADPSVIRRGNLYYATGTSSEWAPHYPLFQSADLFNWKQIGYVFRQTPSWAAASFWAPELFYRKGTYYVYYVARKKTDNISCIGVATSKDPAKGFTDRGILFEFGKEAIDPFVIEENDRLYITFKAYGLDQRPIEILGYQLSDDGLKVEGEPFMLLRDEAKKGLEGQCLVKRGGYYYLLYSLGACCGRKCSYQVEVARSKSLKGPYTRFENNPILAETEEWKCTGHGTVVAGQQGKDYFLYHAYSKTADVFTGRQGMLGEVVWNAETGWPAIKPLGQKASLKMNFRDDFSTGSLSGNWQWDFRHAQPVFKTTKGTLSLSGQVTADNPTGTAVTVRPITGDYKVTAEVVNRNGSLKGLVLYGDAGQSAGIGIRNGMIEAWEVKNKKRSVIKEVAVEGSKSFQLAMNVEKGYQCRFFWREAGKPWNELTTGNGYYNGDYLPPWDRSPRPGLLHQGVETEPAVFSFFEITYR